MAARTRTTAPPLCRASAPARGARRPPGRLLARDAAVLVLAAIATLSLPAAAWNRNDVHAELERVRADWNDNQIELRLDDAAADPLVMIGSPLTLRARASRPSHFTFVLVDAHGEVSVLVPQSSTGSADGAATEAVYPPPGTGQLLQGAPAGLQTAWLVATEHALPPERLGIAAGQDIVTIGREPERVEALARTLADDTLTGRRSLDRFAWQVDANVGIGTRAMRREIELRVQQVDVLDEDARTGSALQAGGNGATPGATGAGASEAAALVQSVPLAIDDVRFETGSAQLTDIGRVQLDILASELLRQGERRAALRIALEGHTDDVGTEADNLALSLARAAAAKRYLVDFGGLDVASIETSGRGESAPRVPNRDAASRQLNRRVEVRVLGG